MEKAVDELADWIMHLAYISFYVGLILGFAFGFFLGKSHELQRKEKE